MALVLLLPWFALLLCDRVQDALYRRGESQATPLERKIQAGDCRGRSLEIEKEEIIFLIGHDIKSAAL